MTHTPEFQGDRQEKENYKELQPPTFDPEDTAIQQNQILAQESSLQRKNIFLNYSSEEYFSSLSQFKFLAITVFVAAIFIIFGLIITRKKHQLSLEYSRQPYTILSEKYDSYSSSSSPSPPPLTPSYPDFEIRQEIKSVDELVSYQFKSYSNFQTSQELQTIVAQVIELAKNKKLSTKELSITLIDVNSGNIAGYQQEILRYPASVVKLFWIVALYGQFATAVLPEPKAFVVDVHKMIKESDNEAASRILDVITNTKSGIYLKQKEYEEWLQKRSWVNRFFQNAGYEDINISQKTFPIPSENMYEPKGRDLQMRLNPNNPNKPIRNKISTQQAARLMYEIVTERAIVPEYSQNLKQWLTWDLKSEYWKNIDPNDGRFNPIRTFFGEFLPTNVQFVSKAGWTSKTRQEVAYIRTSDGKTAYVLAIFAEDRAYAQNWKIFPEISKLVYDRMTARNQ